METLLEFMHTGRVDGVILMGPQLTPASVRLVTKNKRPTVMLNVCKEIKDAVSFNINNYQGAMAITEHLINHGFRKVGIIKGPDGNCDAEERFRGYSDTLEKFELPVDKNLVIFGNFTDRSGYYGFNRLMSLPQKPEAIFAANDMMAIGIYHGARHLGIKIPEDIAVVGFDDMYLSSLHQPRLTTIHVPIFELGS
jgi:LacI family transcriptional regulator